ncbi:2110_t:CDS:2 [Gigaspora rosea]|nr:2110_t:CDS:2 [Gigaspora rosea]
MCKRKNYTAWCQECATSYFKKNFTKWTSGNRKIDETQTNSKILEDFIEWIPYEQLEDIKKVSYGGFGTIYSAYWTQGPLYMDLIGFKRVGRIHVALKSGISSEHLEELQMHIKCCTKLNSYSYNAHGKNGSSPIIRCYGLTKCHKSKNDKEYMLVIQFAENSDLRKYLSKNFYQMRWLEDKMSILANIANGLKIIHNEGLTHLDLHCGNILIDNDRSCVYDFGLSRPFDHKDSTTFSCFEQSYQTYQLPHLLDKYQMHQFIYYQKYRNSYDSYQSPVNLTKLEERNPLGSKAPLRICK